MLAPVLAALSLLLPHGPAPRSALPTATTVSFLVRGGEIAVRLADSPEAREIADAARAGAYEGGRLAPAGNALELRGGRGAPRLLLVAADGSASDERGERVGEIVRGRDAVAALGDVPDLRVQSARVAVNFEPTSLSAPADADAPHAPPERSGRKVTLVRKNADLREVVDRLARAIRRNVVIGPAVRGHVTVNLHDVPVEDALAAILGARGLTYAVEGDVVTVGPRRRLSWSR